MSKEKDNRNRSGAIDFWQPDNYTLNERERTGDDVRQLKIEPELRSQIREYLEKQGYTITEEAKIQGKSGVEHTFDMLAQRDDGFTTYTIAICIAIGGDVETEVATIFDFANKAYDTGIQGRVLIAIPELSQEAEQLAQKQRIKVVGEEQIGALLDLKPEPPVKPKEPLKFETEDQLRESLVNLGYRVEEKARVRGRSGVEYTFDLLAYTDTDQVSHSLGIDFQNNIIDPMLTTSDVARLLNVHINTVRRWSNQGILKAYRIGSRGDRRFRSADVASFLAEQPQNNNNW